VLIALAGVREEIGEGESAVWVCGSGPATWWRRTPGLPPRREMILGQSNQNVPAWQGLDMRGVYVRVCVCVRDVGVGE
jgi:hypothetical protein